jgi:hypothetical protein
MDPVKPLSTSWSRPRLDGRWGWLYVGTCAFLSMLAALEFPSGPAFWFITLVIACFPASLMFYLTFPFISASLFGFEDGSGAIGRIVGSGMEGILAALFFVLFWTALSALQMLGFRAFVRGMRSDREKQQT